MLFFLAFVDAEKVIFIDDPTVKTLKIGTPYPTDVTILQLQQFIFSIMQYDKVSKNPGRIASSVDPDQTAPGSALFAKGLLCWPFILHD